MVRRDELEAPGAGAADILRRVPGLSVADTGGVGAPATASLRGATAAQTPVYLGGVRLNDEVGGAVDLGTLPLWLLERVEVYRGHAPMQADRLGIGGAIFLEPVAPTRSSFGAGALVGSFGSRGAWAHAAVRAAPHALLIGVRTQAAENTYAFEDDGGTHFTTEDDRVRSRRNLDVTLGEVWVLGRTDLDRGGLKLLFNHVAREQGVPRLVGSPSVAARAELDRQVAAVSGRTWLSESAFVELQTAAVFAGTRLRDPLLELGLRTPETEVQGERISQNVAVEARAGALVLRPALDVSLERLRRFEHALGAPDAPPSLVAHRTAVRGALALRARLAGPLHASALGGALCHATSARGTAGVCDALDPVGRVGASVELPRFMFYGNLGRYVRLPTLGELYGMSLVVRGNPDLDVERALSAEAGARYVLPLRGQIRPLFVDLGAHARWQSDLIAFARTTQGYLVPQNVAKGRVAGVELDAGAGFLSHFAGRVALSAVDPRDTTPDRTPHDVLPFQPQLTVSPALEALARPGGDLLHSLRAELRFYHRSGFFTDLAGLGTVPSQSWLDLEVSAHSADERLRVSVRGANLLDADRFDIVGFPLPRRSVFVATEVRF